MNCTNLVCVVRGRSAVHQGYMGKVLVCGFYNVFLGSFWCKCVPRIGIGIVVECDGICKMACQGYWRPMEGGGKLLYWLSCSKCQLR